LLLFCGENSYNKQTMNVDETAGSVRRIIVGFNFREPLHADGVDLGDPVLKGGPFDLILYLAIPENVFQGDEFPLLERFGELREIPPGIDAMPFSVGLVVALIVLPAFLGCDVEEDVLFVVLTALAARNSSLLIRCILR
jgi:hypothetical protein